MARSVLDSAGGEEAFAAIIGMWRFRHAHVAETSHMKSIMDTTKRFLRDEGGPTATEYAVMLTLVIFVCLGAIGGLGGTVSELFASTEAAFGGS
jgi:pilus assembly protein Flp/PilA